MRHGMGIRCSGRVVPDLRYFLAATHKIQSDQAVWGCKES